MKDRTMEIENNYWLHWMSLCCSFHCVHGFKLSQLCTNAV